MPSVAKGVHELRVKDAANAYQVFYYIATADGILVLHAFVKKSQETPPAEIRLATQRLKAMLDA
jgi:phage-related protein